ncbi:Gfo/Idh/MocA family protein [Tropicimonas sp. IMCC6043]|uniref:Gfo/Idh/MocA family protein n=1 Tax=Tropicimonas sp. IMCC6043 TaxID=2510645 RepID=UPI00101CC34D|nr:Gfo/Idh/MocA family oxidoreductase [Tropicimonas sp. IMCC6043]RYH11618.1 Gfo/Idh/MocA family oxidoreductase [Tropicimonas sp. IMCC6043]
MEPLTLGVIDIDHRHIYGQLANLLALGCTCKGWWTEGEPGTLEGFVERFPDVPRVADRRALLDDPEIDVILMAGIPAVRADHAIEAMRAGKDVMTDKPGCTTMEQLAALRTCVAETGRIWSIDFSERFEVPAVSRAAELVRAGAIGQVVQTVGLGPHRLNRDTRPDWFFEEERYGGILTDIASHQIDQFLFFTGAEDAEVVSASVGNFANPDDKGLQDFGEILLRSEAGQGYIRVDWYTPDALPTWGDGRLTILGTEGYIELRKYVDVAGRPGTDHLFLVNGDRCEHIDASGDPLPYFENFMRDVRDRSETAMAQSHCFKVMELALQAQEKAVRLGNLQ